MCPGKARKRITLDIQVYFPPGALLPSGTSAWEVRGCSALPNTILFAILFNLDLRLLGDIIRHHGLLSLVPG